MCVREREVAGSISVCVCVLGVREGERDGGRERERDGESGRVSSE